MHQKQWGAGIMNMPTEDSLERLLSLALLAYAKCVKTGFLTVLSLRRIRHYTQAERCQSE